jgi:hypothetical protein
MTQYPGHDPDDPFSRPPNEQGSNPAAAPPPGQPGTEETAPIQGEEMGYWERKAQEDQQRLADEAHRQAQYGSEPTPEGQPTPPPVGQDQPQQPVTENPWAGYGQPAPPHPQGYQQGFQQPGYPPPAYGQPGYPAYGYAAQAPNHPQSTTALVLGLVGLIGGFVTCGAVFLVSPFAWVIGAKAKREVAASNGQLGGGGANAGFVLGIIGTVLLVVAVLLWALVIGLSVADSTTGTSTTPY